MDLVEKIIENDDSDEVDVATRLVRIGLVGIASFAAGEVVRVLFNKYVIGDDDTAEPEN